MASQPFPDPVRRWPAEGRDDGGVAHALGDLTDLLGDNTAMQDTLHRVVEYGVLTLRALDGAVLRVNEPDCDASAAAGPALVRVVDELQYSLGEGPTLDAIAERSFIFCGSLGGAAAWPRFGHRAERLGIRSVLSTPLLLSRGLVGTITGYSRTENAFGERDVEFAARHAASAAAVVHNAYVLDQGRQKIDQLTQALVVRPVIDQAVGILMSRSGKSAEEALAALRRMSNVERVKLSEIARRIVTDARRAASRRRSPGSARRGW